MTFELEMEEDGPLPPAEWTGFYILDRKRRPILATEDQWKAFEASGGAAIADTDLGEGWSVSTFFEGHLDVEPDEDEQPLLFTTIVQMKDDTQEVPWATWEDAEEGHREIVARYGGG